MTELIELELESGTIESGGVLRGRVVLPKSDPVMEKAKALEVKIVCKVHGSGTSESEEIPLLREPGPFQAGYARPFEVVVPSLPVSWQGQYVKVDWMVHASLDVAWAIDPKIDLFFQLVPRGKKPAATNLPGELTRAS